MGMRPKPYVISTLTGEAAANIDEMFTMLFDDLVDQGVFTDNVIPVAQGGTGATTLTGILKGNGTSAVSAIAIPSDATQFLNGAATPAYAAVKDSDLAVSDVTTNNVTSTKHGLAPKSPADATKFLNGAATPAYAAVKDSDLSTSDITTNNVTIAKHGFVPKAPNDATKFLDGTGAFSVPAGSGGVAMNVIMTRVVLGL